MVKCQQNLQQEVNSNYFEKYLREKLELEFGVLPTQKLLVKSMRQPMRTATREVERNPEAYVIFLFKQCLSSQQGVKN